MRRADLKESVKKLPKRKISFKEAYVTTSDGAYVQRMEVMVTGEMSMSKGQRSSLEETRPHKLIQTLQSGNKRCEPQYIKSRSKSEGRVGARPTSPPPLQPKRTKTPSKINKSKDKSDATKLRSTMLIREDSRSQKKSRSKSKKTKQSANKTTIDPNRRKPGVKTSVIKVAHSKKPSETAHLKKKCTNLIHNRYVLEKKLQERYQAAVKIQAWVRGHLVRRRLQQEYELLMREVEFPLPSLDSTSVSVQSQTAWMVKWNELTKRASARNSINDRIIQQCRKQRSAVNETGVCTSWHAVSQYLRLIKYEVRNRHRNFFERCVGQPFGLPPNQRLRLLTDRQQDINVQCSWLLPDELFDLIEEKLESSELQRMHHQAIFDSFNESLTRLRPYYRTSGQPYPWVSHQSPTQVVSCRAALSSIEKGIQSSCARLCGLIVDSDDQSEQLQCLLLVKREELLNALVKDWLVDCEQTWLYFEDQHTEVGLQLTNHLTCQLIGEFARQMAGIRYIRRFI